MEYVVRTPQRNIGHLGESPVTSGVSISTRNNTASSGKFTGLNVLCPLGDTFQCPMFYIPYMEWIHIPMSNVLHTIYGMDKLLSNYSGFSAHSSNYEYCLL